MLTSAEPEQKNLLGLSVSRDAADTLDEDLFRLQHTGAPKQSWVKQEARCFTLLMEPNVKPLQIKG